MEIMHPHLRLAASLILAAGLVSACGGGGGSSADAPPAPPPVLPPVEPTTTYTDLMGVMSDDCGEGAANENCIITTRRGETVIETRRIVTTTAAMMKTRTETVDGTGKTITIRSTAAGHGNRVISVEELTCTAGANCMLTSFRAVMYKGDGTVNTDITRHYVNGREMRRVSGTGDAAVTTNIMYSSSNGGRTETTVKAGGRLVERFNQIVGGTATSTMFTSTDGNTVTMPDPNDPTMRIETTSAGGRVTEVKTGMPALNEDTGFLATAEIRITRYRVVPSEGTGLVATTHTQGREGANDERPAAVLVSRTYIRTVDADGRETRRETLPVNAGIDGTAKLSDVVTVYPTETVRTTKKTTTEYESGGINVKTVTVMETDSMKKVTTTVYKNDAMDPNAVADANIVTTTVENPPENDDSVTVVTTYGEMYDELAGADSPNVGDKFSVKTSANGRTIVTTVTRGTMTLRTVTRDELGAETEREVFSGNTRTTTETTYLSTGGSTVTTTMATRENADSEYADTGSVVETKDAMGRVTKRETRDKDKKVTGTRVTVYEDRRDGTSVATTMLPAHPSGDDKLRDIEIVTKNAMGDIVSDVVVNPGVQLHTSVSEPQYNTIQDGMAARTDAKTVMGQAILHLNYVNSEAFASFDTGTGNRNLEVEVITTRPSCTADKCTYNDLRHSTGYRTSTVNNLRPATEIRLYETTAPTDAITPNGLGLSQSLGSWAYVPDATTGFNVPETAADPAATRSRWDNNMGSRNAKVVMHQLLADLLNVGGAGAKATYTAPTAGYLASDPPFAIGVTGPKVEVESAAATSPERKTFTYLTETGLPVGVLGIGQQAKRVDSYKLLGGTRDNDPDDPAVGVAVPVKVTVENYFGWMQNSMFTVRRVVATGVTGSKYDWVNGAALDVPGTVRAYFGMVSGTPSDRPSDRSTDSMIDPGTWTGTMIGVGSVQGERYRGRAKVTVNFNNNNVTTAFDQINLAQYSDADFTENLNRFGGVPVTLRDGIEFTSTGGITSEGSYTSDTLKNGFADTNKISSLYAQFYGDGKEVAGTFNAYQMALGTGSEFGTARGDLVGAFGAARDPMTERPADN